MQYCGFVPVNRCCAAVPHLSCAALGNPFHLPLPLVTRHSSGDSVSWKKLDQGEGLWEVCKEILGWMFDGARRCLELPPKKVEAILGELCVMSHLQSVPIKRFKKLMGKLRHAAIGILGVHGLFSPLNQALQNRPRWINLGRSREVYQALQDFQVLLRAVSAVQCTCGNSCRQTQM